MWRGQCPPPCGSGRNGCKGTVPPERLPVPARCRVSIEFQLQGHRGSPLVCRHPRGDWLALWGHGPPCCQAGAGCLWGAWPPALSSFAVLHGHPSPTGSHTSVLAGQQQQPGSSRIAAVANTLQTAQPALPPHPRRARLSSGSRSDAPAAEPRRWRRLSHQAGLRR